MTEKPAKPSPLPTPMIDERQFIGEIPVEYFGEPIVRRLPPKTSVLRQILPERPPQQ